MTRDAVGHAVDALLSAFPWAGTPKVSEEGRRADVDVSEEISFSVVAPAEGPVILRHLVPSNGLLPAPAVDALPGDRADAVGAVSALVATILENPPPEWLEHSFVAWRHDPSKPKVGIPGGGTSGQGGFIVLSPDDKKRRGLHAVTDADPAGFQDEGMAGLDGSRVLLWTPAGPWEPAAGLRDLILQGFFVPVPAREALVLGIPLSVAGQLALEVPTVSATPLDAKPVDVALFAKTCGAVAQERGKFLCRISSASVEWDGTVVAWLDPKNAPPSRVPVGKAKDPAALAAMAEIAEWQRGHYPSETLQGGAVHFHPDGSAGGRVNRQGGGWSWPGIPRPVLGRLRK